nr:hypothetical protein [Tanacetum cinerariifolium]
MVRILNDGTGDGGIFKWSQDASQQKNIVFCGTTMEVWSSSFNIADAFQRVNSRFLYTNRSLSQDASQQKNIVFCGTTMEVWSSSFNIADAFQRVNSRFLYTNRSLRGCLPPNHHRGGGRTMVQPPQPHHVVSGCGGATPRGASCAQPFDATAVTTTESAVATTAALW